MKKAKKEEKERLVRESAFSITKQIDINFRNYALYVLENRGIPNFYDGLTNVQRVALMNAPKTFNKTISLVGSCISNGYHHGDCLKYDTIIHLADGSTITIGEWCDNYPDAKLILSSYDTKTGKIVDEIGHSPRIGYVTDEVFEIEMSDGTIETCTGNHPWFTQRGWVTAENLTENDEILNIETIYNQIYGITKRILPEKQAMYDITVDRTACFFVGKSKSLTHNTSLSKAINKMARPFGCGEQLLVGDGFFGTPVNPDASATRYTSVKINGCINDVINKYMVLNCKNGEDQWEWLRTEVPIGNLTTIIGLAVGYKSTILPRKMEEIVKFLDGKKACLDPYFKGFTGKISSYNGLKKTWLIEGVQEVNETAKTIQLLELPPLMKYESFIKKLARLAEANIDFSIQNDSSDNVDITLKYKGGETWEDFKDKIDKIIKMIVTETLILVKDSSVIEYADMTDYFTEFRVHRERVRLDKAVYDLGVYNSELEFFKAKLIYLKYMLGKKRADTEIEVFLSQFNSGIKNRLERIMLRELCEESIPKVELLISEMLSTISTEEKTKSELEISLEKLIIETPTFSKQTKNRAVDLFVNDETDEIDGIEVFNTEELEEELLNDEE